MWAPGTGFVATLIPPAPSVCKLSVWTRPVTATRLCVRYSTHVKYMFTSGGDSVHSHTLSQRSRSSYKKRHLFPHDHTSQASSNH